MSTENNKKTLIDLFDRALTHSTAQAFLIFSGFLVVYSMGLRRAKEYIYIAFFTFFYAFFAHRIKVISRKEVWGDYAIGDNCGAGLYFLIDWLSFMGWVAGSMCLLKGIKFVIFPATTITFFSLALVLFIFWIVRTFCKKDKYEKRDKKCKQLKLKKKEYYEAECYCGNCGWNVKSKNL